MPCHLKKISLLAEKYPTNDYYPFNMPVFRQTNQIDFKKPVTMFAGENGSGKSTLLEAIARACEIYIWNNSGSARTKVNHYEKQLYRFIAVEWVEQKIYGSFFGANIFKDFTYILEEWASTDPGLLHYFGGKSLVSQSHGQSIMSFFRSRYHLPGLYLLDEPETALSPKSQLELLEILNACGENGNAQFIIATHSPILLACKNADIYSFDKIPVSLISYKETEHFKVYKDFLACE